MKKIVLFILFMSLCTTTVFANYNPSDKYKSGNAKPISMTSTQSATSSGKIQNLLRNFAIAASNRNMDEVNRLSKDLYSLGVSVKEVSSLDNCPKVSYSYRGREYTETYCKNNQSPSTYNQNKYNNITSTTQSTATATHSQIQIMARNLAIASANNNMNEMTRITNDLLRQKAIVKHITVDRNCHEVFYTYGGREYSEKYCK